jgi:hypothetical protein
MCAISRQHTTTVLTCLAAGAWVCRWPCSAEGGVGMLVVQC